MNEILNVVCNYGEMSDLEKSEASISIRNQFENIMRGDSPKTKREKEIDKLAREELEEYKRKRKAFYDNPVHWDNNKRRRHGLSALRKTVNKYRIKEYPEFRPSVRLFCMIEDMMDEILSSVMWSYGFNSFVDIKDIVADDEKTTIYSVI